MNNKKKKIVDIVSLTLIGLIILLIALVAPSYQYGLLGVKHEMQKAQEGQVRVACVGDSLTYGTNVKDWKINNYPKQLQNKLGSSYVVNNYGLPGGTVLNSSKKYGDSKVFKESLQFKPDIVVIMLGSNDTWQNTNEIQNCFITEYTKLIKEYKKANPSVQIKLLIPPKAHKLIKKEMFYISDDKLLKQINPKIEEIASSESIGLINVRNAISNDKKLYSSDKIHVNSKGTKVIANLVYENLK